MRKLSFSSSWILGDAQLPGPASWSESTVHWASQSLGPSLHFCCSFTPLNGTHRGSKCAFQHLLDILAKGLCFCSLLLEQMVNECACVCTCVFKQLSLKCEPEIKQLHLIYLQLSVMSLHMHPQLSKRAMISQIVFNFSTIFKSYLNTWQILCIWKCDNSTRLLQKASTRGMMSHTVFHLPHFFSIFLSLFMIRTASLQVYQEKKKGHSMSFIPSFPPVLISMNHIYCFYNSNTKGQDNFSIMNYVLLLRPPETDLGCKVSNKLLSGLTGMQD